MHAGMPRKRKFQHRKAKERNKRLQRSKLKPSATPASLDSIATSPTSDDHITTKAPLAVTNGMAPPLVSTIPGTNAPALPSVPTVPATSATAPPSTSSVPAVNITITPPSFESIVLPNSAWIKQSSQGGLAFCKLCQLAGSSAAPFALTYTLQVFQDGTWLLYVHGKKIDRNACAALHSFPETLSPTELSNLLQVLDKLHICAGHPDPHLVEMVSLKKGKIVSKNGEVAAYVDENPVELNGTSYGKTVRSARCELIGHSIKCSSCTSYRGNLRVIYSRWHKMPKSTTDVSSHTNNRYLKTPEKVRKIAKLRSKSRIAQQKWLRLCQKYLSEKESEVVDDSLATDLVSIMKENDQKIKESFPEGSFSRLF